ncbi:MAG: endonuclease [Muribaculaceae bacterium]|jgi:endonuclease I|nr:endonuclease [Muribaculaceae bacterium]
MKKGLSFLLFAFVCSYVFAAVPSGYYDAAKGKNKSELLSTLCTIVGPHTDVGYSGLWKLYYTTDETPDGKIWDMYSTTKFTPGDDQCGTYSAVGDCYNREHSFPKSWFNDASPMVSDAFHIYPTDGKVNNQRSNYPYGECANGTQLSANGNNKPLGRLGTSTFAGYSGIVFEPDDQYKGDFARSYFYMMAAYNNKVSSWSSPMLAGNSYPCFSTWAINMLLKWSREDTVSQKERDRNEAVYAAQKNRNPFIDYPELAEYIWGNNTSNEWTPGGVITPILVSPSNGDVLDLGATTVNRALTGSLTVKGTGLTSDLTVTVSGNSAFSSSVATITAAQAKAGFSLPVQYLSSVASVDSATITISSGQVSASVKLEAQAVTGIPALDATGVTTESFVARWVDVSGDGSNYSLYLLDSDGTSVIQGYPVSVAASAGSYVVTGLNPSHDYYYYLTNGTVTSNKVKVTTTALIPSLSITVPEGGLTFTAQPGAASDAIEVAAVTDNISDAVTASVTGNFEISLDKSVWSQSLTLDPQGESFYVRMKATDAEDTYTGILQLISGSTESPEIDVLGVVTSTVTFIETFDTMNHENYDAATGVQGAACKWNLLDAGTFSSTNSDRFNGTKSIRMGKTSSSSITMAEDKANGAGTLVYYTGVYGSDEHAAVEVDYSLNAGSTWTKLALDSVTEKSLVKMTHAVKQKGNIRFRFVQTAGKRFNIDDISLTDFANSSVSSVSAAASWDAYSRVGSVVIVSDARRMVEIYSLDARLVYKAKVQRGESVVALPQGLYVVVSGNSAKKVIVH